jgi:CRP-like cAMP-binding protein
VTEYDRLALMSRSDLLSTLEPPTRAAAAKLMTVRFVPRGAALLEQSAPMEGILFIHRGRLRVVEVNDEAGERVVARIEAGDHFGERALVNAVSAPQTLVADTDSCILELTKAALDTVLQKDPNQSKAMAGTVRLKLQTAQRKAAKPPALPTAQAAPSVRTDDFDNVVTSTNVEIVGEDKKILQAKERLEGFAKDELPVFIIGPQGSGKRTFARRSHHVGPHKGQPYLEMIGEGTLAIAHAELLDAHLQALLAAYLKLGWFHRL